MGLTKQQCLQNLQRGGRIFFFQYPEDDRYKDHSHNMEKERITTRLFNEVHAAKVTGPRGEKGIFSITFYDGEITKDGVTIPDEQIMEQISTIISEEWDKE